jgi:predicted neutral ceramidase superfamily lipid hydrolase
MICYKIYSLVVAIFDFMHTTSMYVVYTLIMDSLFYVVKNQIPKKLGADASPFIWALHSTLVSCISCIFQEQIQMSMS